MHRSANGFANHIPRPCIQMDKNLFRYKVQNRGSMNIVRVLLYDKKGCTENFNAASETEDPSPLLPAPLPKQLILGFHVPLGNSTWVACPVSTL